MHGRRADSRDRTADSVQFRSHEWHVAQFGSGHHELDVGSGDSATADYSLWPNEEQGLPICTDDTDAHLVTS